jgi:hypothetical protein
MLILLSAIGLLVGMMLFTHYNANEMEQRQTIVAAAKTAVMQENSRSMALKSEEAAAPGTAVTANPVLNQSAPFKAASAMPGDPTMGGRISFARLSAPPKVPDH